MNTYRSVRRLAWVLAFVGALPLGSARADIYTWVDAKGNLNLTNRPPPEGAHVTNVFREDPAVAASAEAARAAAQREDMKALTDRVTQLERDLETAKQPPPTPIAYLPVPAPAPAPYPPVITQTIVTPAAPTYATYGAYGDCTDPWASCLSPGYFGFYPSGVIVVSAPSSHRFRPNRRDQRMPSPQAFQLPKPVGALPDPVNLFPGTHVR